jgi:hypothetical protein
MNLTTILTWVLRGELILLVGLLLLFFGHGAWSAWQRKRSDPLLVLARKALVTALEAEEIPNAERNQMAALSVRLQVRMFGDIAPSLGGGQRQKLAVLAREMNLTVRATSRCQSKFWWRRLQGARLFTLLGGGDDIMPPLFRDRHPAVRAQVAEWAADYPRAENIDSLLSLLSDPIGLCRFTAQDSLLRMGNVVIEPVVQYLAHHSGHKVEAALQVAEGVADPRFLTPALVLCRDESSRVRALAATLLGTLGGSEGVEILTFLLADVSPEVRAAAARTLGKLHHWPTAARLAGLLRDHTWIARQAAGLALRSLGAPGQLFLRRFCTDADQFAADMARQVLDLPEEVGLAESL